MSSLLEKYLTPELEAELKDRVTPHGTTLELVTRSGRMHPESKIGVYAGDAESYESAYFGPLFDPIIAEYHGFPADGKHASDLDPAHLGDMPNLDPSGARILSTRVRVARNVAGFAFAPSISREDRLELEHRMVEAFKALPPELAGTYYPLGSMSEADRQHLVEAHLLFRDDDPVVGDAGMYRDWPEGRGIFLSKDEKFFVWVSEEDQRIGYLDEGADIRQVFTMFSTGLKSIESSVPFARNDRYGNLTSCPTNLGTGMRASVMIKLPKISKDETAFKDLCKSKRLQARGMHGEHSESGAGGIFDVSNRQRLGSSETDQIRTLYDGVKELIEMEASA